MKRAPFYANLAGFKNQLGTDLHTVARYRNHHPVFTALLLGAGLLSSVHAETSPGESATDDRWANCAPPQGSFAEVPPVSDTQPGQTSLSADEVVSTAGGVSRFSGEVVVERDGRTLQGDSAQYDQASGEVVIEGNVRFHAPELTMQSERASVRLEEGSGEFNGVSFYYPQQHAFGSAESMSRSDSQHSSLKGVRYTTCSPGHEDWLLSADELELDQESNTGEAYHTVLRFKGVPIFYSPYLNFPLAGRKSGLLPPTVGSSDSTGTDTRLPIYWNIAPNYDATFTPRNMTRRGPMLMSEFRLLTEHSEGEIEADYLSEDKISGEERHYLSVDHRTHFGNYWRTTLVASDVSDPLYLSEIGAEGVSDATSHLERRFDLNFDSPHWHLLARAQDYQPLLGAEPYQRMPQITLSGNTARRPNRLLFQLQGEAVTFAHESVLPTGTRLDAKPSVSLPLQGAAWYLTPTAAWRQTDYTLDDGLTESHLSRSVPIYSVDSGLFFDRETTIAGRAMTHTIEPRLYYLSVPYEDQEALPLFDTGYSDFSFSQLFRDNRFSGTDRQGDAEQLTTALTTRLLDETDGVERFRASIGQIHYYRDREVTLQPGETIDTNPESDLFAELELRPTDHFSFAVDAQYDTETEREERINGRIRYRSDHKHQLYLDYRYDDVVDISQSDLVVFWPLARRWQFLGRWQYDLTNEENLDVVAGVEYESCCWAVRVIGRNHLTATDEVDNSVYLTFEFKGLGSLGAKLEEALDDDILTE